MRLEFITGPMFSGKTEELMRRLRRAEYAKKKILVCRPSSDSRTKTDTIGSHVGRVMSAQSIDSAHDIRTTPEIDVLGIDEVSFIPFIYSFVVDFFQHCRNRTTTVILAGLDKDWRGEPFNDDVARLLAMADEVTKLTSICMKCGQPATMSHRLTSTLAQTEYGGAGKYEARCRLCHDFVIVN